MDKLESYKELRDRARSHAQNYTNDESYYNLVNTCVCMYEINLIKYNLTSDEKYKLSLNTISKILDVFLNIEQDLK